MVKGRIKVTCKWYSGREGWFEKEGKGPCVMFYTKERKSPYRIALLPCDVEEFEWQN